jgi:hypothetical protein
MGTAVIRHNDFKEPMEEIARGIFGSNVELISKEGESGEQVPYVIGEGVSPHSLDDLERLEWVLSAKYVR